MFGNRGFWIMARSVLTLVLLQVPLVACTGKVSSGTAGPQMLGPLSVLQAYRIARERALEWCPDSYLEGVSVVWSGPDPFIGPEKVRVSFFVDRKLGPIPWWESATVWVSRSCTCVEDMGTHFYLAREPRRNFAFDLSGVALDSQDVLLLAEALGGEGYRASYANARIRMRIVHGQYGTSQLFWFIEYYRPPDMLGAELSFYVDASTGAVSGDAILTSAQAREVLRRAKDSGAR
jgi:hypothetical protein